MPALLETGGDDGGGGDDGAIADNGIGAGIERGIGTGPRAPLAAPTLRDVALCVFAAPAPQPAGCSTACTT
jgi:hypothetical protein